MGRSKLVPSFLTVTFALAMAAPDGSVTLPRMVLWMACPFAATAASSNKPGISSSEQCLENNLIFPPKRKTVILL
jgi:hypothetical protein